MPKEESLEVAQDELSVELELADEETDLNGEDVEEIVEPDDESLAQQEEELDEDEDILDIKKSDYQTTAVLKKVKGIFDPNNIMNTGKLCF